MPRENLLRDVAVGTSGAVADTFLWTLVRLLGNAYDGVCWLSELIDERTALRALACWPAGTLPAGATHQLGSTPASGIFETGLVAVPTGVSAAFPADPFLGRQALDGYLAVACPGTGGGTVGVLELATAEPLQADAEEIVALKVFACWVGEEIERRADEATLLARETELIASRANVVAAADDERRRIGRDLHDGVQQRVLAMKMLVDAACQQLDGTISEDASELLSEALAEAATVGDELRELARGLHPAGLAERGLAGALEHLGRHSGVALELRALPDRRLPAPIELTVYYIVSEALTNAARYADASTLTVECDLGPRTLRVVVTDDGRGGADPDAGSGLRGLSDRVTSLGGVLAIVSPPGVGTTLSAEIPLVPFRDARDPFIEINTERNPDRAERILSGDQPLTVTLAREWDLEGGPPRIGQELAVRDHEGQRHGAVTVTRCAVMPLSLIDADIAAAIRGHAVELDAWRAEIRAFYENCRGDYAAMFDEPDWHLEPDPAMVIIWFEPVSIS